MCQRERQLDKRVKGGIREKWHTGNNDSSLEMCPILSVHVQESSIAPSGPDLSHIGGVAYGRY